MAAADTAKLVASLTLDAKGFQSGVAKAQKSLGGLEGTVGNIGKRAGEGLRTFSRNIALIGVAAAGVIAVGVKGGLDNLAKLEDAITSVDGAIDQMGLQGQVTGKEVAKWANDIERDIDAAFDDKDITAAAATLLRFGKVTPKNLKPALEIVADLAVKTGDVESASELLAKALADPAKAAGKLARQGIILTKAQQDTIKAMLEQNDIAGAQQVILEEVAKTTEGAAAASQGKYKDAINVLNDVVEDAQKALATGFLPVLERVADMLSTRLADPAFIKGLEDFGTTLAGGLDDLISVAEKLPWGTIGTSLQIAGAGAKTLLDAFVGLPPWVQTAVITGWGLNKLTGGALGGIVAELGKGLIKGVLGIQAAQVNITAANVSGIGTGAAGAAGAAGGASKVLGAVQKVFMVGIAGVVGFEIASELAKRLGASVSDDPVDNFFRVVDGFKAALNQGGLFDAFSPGDGNKINQHLSESIATSKAEGAKNQQAAFAVKDAVNQGATTTQQAAFAIRDAEVASKYANQQAAFQVRDAVRTTGSTLAARSESLRAATAAGLERTRAAAQAAAFAIRDKDLSVSVATTNVINNTVSVRETIHTQTTYKQYQRFNQ